MMALRRIVQAGVIPGCLSRSILNKWLSSSYDLFGTDHFFVGALGVRMGNQGPL